MLAKMLRQFVQHAGVGLLGIPRMDAQRDGADFRLPQQRERVCPIGVFGGGHDKLAHLRGAGLGDDLRQPENRAGWVRWVWVSVNMALIVNIKRVTFNTIKQ